MPLILWVLIGVIVVAVGAALYALQGARAPDPPRGKEAPRYLLSSTTLLLVRGRALNLSLYSNYDTPADLEWIRTTTLRWVDDIQRLNNR